MKKTTILLIVGILAISVLAGCGKAPDSVTPDTNQIPTNQPTDNGNQATDKSDDTLNQIVALMNQDDTAIVAALGEGTANYLDGSTTHILSREYTLPLFAADTNVVMNYDDNQVAVSATVLLVGKKLDDYKADLEAFLGATQDMSADGKDQEGSGKKAYVWNTDKAIITLQEAYDTIIIDISAVTK